MAYKSDNNQRLYQLQRKLLKQVEPVSRVVTVSGSKTPGIDNQLWNSPKNRVSAIKVLRGITKNPRGYKAKFLLRVWIPKENGTEHRICHQNMTYRSLITITKKAS